MNYVRKENIPIVSYVPNDDCEFTLIYPPTISIPHKVCGQRMLTLEQTYSIPLHLSNEWLFTAPTRELRLFTVLYGTEKFQLPLQKRGKLYLPTRCKGYSTHSTLYTLSTPVRSNSQDNVLSIASVDCCLTQAKREQLHEIPLQKTLTNILSYVEDLKIASVKIDDGTSLVV